MADSRDPILELQYQTFNLLHRPYDMIRHRIATTTNVLFSCLVYKLFDATHNPQLDDPFSRFDQSQRGTAAMQERVETEKTMTATCCKNTGYVDDIRASYVSAPQHARQSPSPTTLKLHSDRKHVLHVYLLVSLLAYYYEYVFNDIQISAHILP